MEYPPILANEPILDCFAIAKTYRMVRTGHYAKAELTRYAESPEKTTAVNCKSRF